MADSNYVADSNSGRASDVDGLAVFNRLEAQPNYLSAPRTKRTTVDGSLCQAVSLANYLAVEQIALLPVHMIIDHLKIAEHYCLFTVGTYRHVENGEVGRAHARRQKGTARIWNSRHVACHLNTTSPPVAQLQGSIHIVVNSTWFSNVIGNTSFYPSLSRLLTIRVSNGCLILFADRLKFT